MVHELYLEIIVKGKAKYFYYLYEFLKRKYLFQGNIQIVYL